METLSLAHSPTTRTSTGSAKPVRAGESTYHTGGRSSPHANVVLFLGALLHKNRVAGRVCMPRSSRCFPQSVRHPRRLPHVSFSTTVKTRSPGTATFASHRLPRQPCAWFDYTLSDRRHRRDRPGSKQALCGQPRLRRLQRLDKSCLPRAATPTPPTAARRTSVRGRTALYGAFTHGPTLTPRARTLRTSRSSPWPWVSGGSSPASPRRSGPFVSTRPAKPLPTPSASLFEPPPATNRRQCGLDPDAVSWHGGYGYLRRCRTPTAAASRTN